MWQISPESSGESVSSKNIDENILNINGLVVNGKLKFSISSRLNEEETQKVRNSLRKYLLEILEHCSNCKYTSYSIRDFKDFEIYIQYASNESRKSKTCFLFPPGEGGAESYINNLIPTLSELNIIAFNNFYLFLSTKKKEQKELCTFEYLASEYISIIRQIQKNGPYILAGHSFGGVLALEIARQLNELDEPIEKVIIIDAYFNQCKVMNNFIKENCAVFFKDNINCKYLQSNIRLNSECSVTLFKATKKDNASKLKGYSELYFTLNEYYTNTYDNLFENVYRGNFEVIQYNGTHLEWIKDANVVKLIAQKIKD